MHSILGQNRDSFQCNGGDSGTPVERSQEIAFAPCFDLQINFMNLRGFEKSDCRGKEDRIVGDVK
jgi:hypothetical protein